MRQAPQLPRKSSKPSFHPFLVFLFVVSLLASGFTILLSLPEKEIPLSTMQETVLARTAEVLVNNSYSLTVEESGPGYSLRFNGQVENGFIYGKMDTYDLELFTDQEKYFVKGSGVFAEWEEMEHAQLDALSVVVRDPQMLLELLLAGREILVEEGPLRTVENVVCQTYFLEIPPPDIQLLTRFEKEATLDKLQMYLWFAQDDQFLYRMALLMNVSVENDNVQINRIYSLNPQTKEMPEGLPQLNNNFYAI